MIMNRKTGRIDPVETIGDIQRFIPDVQREVSLSLIPVDNVGSSEVLPDHWTQIAGLIKKHYARFDGFVVIHGSNTVCFTAAALSFALQNLSKPVILTGSILPMNDPASDGRSNLVFAIRAACLDIAEVCVVFGKQVLRGTRCKKVHESIQDTFQSPRFPPLAEFKREFVLHPWRMVRRRRNLLCQPNFNANVSLLTLHPGIPRSFLNSVLDSGLHGIVLRGYGPGMVPNFLVSWLQELTSREIPIVMTSQVMDSCIDLHCYRKQLVLEKMGIISGKDMTYECALAKLMWVLGQTHQIKKVHKLMEKNLVGEIDTN